MVAGRIARGDDEPRRRETRRVVGAAAAFVVLGAAGPAWASASATLELRPVDAVFFRLLQLLILILVGLGVRAVVRTRETFRGVTALERLALAAALLAGLVIRLLLLEPVAIHENYAGMARATCAAQSFCHNATASHHWASYAFYNLVFAVSEARTPVLFAVNALLGGGVLPLLVFFLGWRLLGRASTGVVAAWLLALLPLHARVSASDSFYTLAQVLLVAAVLAVVTLARARRGRLGRALLAGVLTALAAQSSRVYGLVLVVAPLALALTIDWRHDARPRARHLLVAAFTFVAASLVHWRDVIGAGSWAEGAVFLPGSVGEALYALGPNNVYLDPLVTPPLVVVAWVVGAGVLLLGLGRGRRRDGWVVLLLFLAFAAVFLPADPEGTNHPTRWRMQVNLAPAVALLGAAGLAWGARWMAGRAAIVAIAFLVFATAGSHGNVAHEALLPALEQRYLERTLPTLPPAEVVVIADRCMQLPGVDTKGQCVETQFPLHDLATLRARPVRSLRAGQALADREALRGRQILLYRGTTWSAWLPEELAALGGGAPPHRPEWEELLDAFDLHRVTEDLLPNVNPDRVRNHFVVGKIPVGFYWMTLR